MSVVLVSTTGSYQRGMQEEGAGRQGSLLITGLLGKSDQELTFACDSAGRSLGHGFICVRLRPPRATWPNNMKAEAAMPQTFNTLLTEASPHPPLLLRSHPFAFFKTSLRQVTPLSSCHKISLLDRQLLKHIRSPVLTTTKKSLPQPFTFFSLSPRSSDLQPSS